MRATKLNILILAAGLSTRLGEPKALARIQGITLLRRALMLGASLAPHAIFAVVPSRCPSYRNQATGIKVRFIANTRRAEGLAGSVQMGIRRARFASAIMILPVDLYALKSRDLLRLLARWRARPGVSAAARIGTRGGVPIILPARIFSAAEHLQGDCGFRNLLSSFAPPPALLDIPAAAFDIDTRQDLQAARLRRHHPSGAVSGFFPKRKIAKHI